MGIGVTEVIGNPLLLGFWDYLPLLGGPVGAVLALTRARALLWTAGAFICATYLVVGGTGAVVPAARALVRQDRLQPVEAVVVLSSDIQRDGDLTAQAQDRLLHGLEVLHGGFARRLVLTRLPPPKKSYVPAVREEMRQLGLDYPIDETGAVASTHDEALAVGALARRKGWDRVILVSSPTHTRRAGAMFEKAGVRVLCSPCVEREFDLESLNTMGDRLKAFRHWLHETVSYEVNRRRGWL